MAKIVLPLFATLLLLAACATTPPAPLASEPIVPEQPALPEQPSLPETAPPKSDIPTPGEPDRTAFADFPTDVREILDNAQSRSANGFEYTYLKHVKNLPVSDVSSESRIYQRGAIMKIEFNDDQVIRFVKQRSLAYNVALINVEAKSVDARCTDVKVCQGDLGTRSVSYDDVMFHTPMYWYEQMKSPKKVTQQTIDGRSVYILEATVNDEKVQVAVDRFSGVPVKVTAGDTVYEYQRFALGVTDEELKV